MEFTSTSTQTFVSGFVIGRVRLMGGAGSVKKVWGKIEIEPRPNNLAGGASAKHN